MFGLFYLSIFKFCFRMNHAKIPIHAKIYMRIDEIYIYALIYAENIIESHQEMEYL